LGRINFDFYGQIGVRVNGYSKKSEIWFKIEPNRCTYFDNLNFSKSTVSSKDSLVMQF
jgi:hypothetical protein